MPDNHAEFVLNLPVLNVSAQTNKTDKAIPIVTDKHFNVSNIEQSIDVPVEPFPEDHGFKQLMNDFSMCNLENSAEITRPLSGTLSKISKPGW